MYDTTANMIVAFIKLTLPNLEVFDATEEFKNPSDYASFYIMDIKPTSPHENLVDQTQVNAQAHTKKFIYKETSKLNIKVDFRGDNASANIASFKSSFLSDDKRIFLKEAGFGFLGLSTVQPINSLRESKAKLGFTTNLKLLSSLATTDESPIIDTISIKVSNKL